MIRGNRRALNNIFGWKKVSFNLSGSHRYNPSIPWVYKMTRDNKITAEFYFYIDDGRPIASTEING